MKKSIAIFLFLCIASFNFAQITVSGKVINTEKQPVSFASVTIYDKLTNKTITFKNTNSKGEYSFQLKEAGTFVIKVRNIKYTEHEEEITILPETKQFTFNAELKNVEALNEVVYKGANLASIKGDTITFRVDRFTDKTEKTLGDIINKLPGMEVDEQGNIKANGEKVDKLLVEGQEFYSGSQKMATQNLQAEAVKNVQLLTDYKENGKLDDMNGEKQTAVNINLKDDYKNKITGDILGGTGYEEKYDSHLNLFRFNKTGNISVIADAQNTGASVLTFDDYLGFIGGFSEMQSIGRRGNNFSLNFDSGISSLLHASNDVEERSNQLAAINITQNLNAKNKIKFMNIFAHSKQNAFSQTNKTYFENDVNGNPILETEISTDEGRNWFNNTTFKYEYQPNDSTLVKYNLGLNFSESNDNSHIYNDFNSQIQNFDDGNTSKPWSISNVLEFEKKLNKRLLFGLSASFEYRKEPKVNDIRSTQPYLDIFNSTTLSEYATDYHELNLKKEANFISSLKYSRWKKIFKLESGVKISSFNLDTDLFQLLNGSYSELAANRFKNRLDYSRYDVFADISMSKNKDFWQYELGTIFKYYDINLKDQQETFSRFAVYPYADISMNFSTSNVLIFNYALTDEFPSMRQYVNNEYINSYRSIYTLLNVLPNTFIPSHRLSLNYRYFNQFSGISLFGRMGYSQKDENISTRSSFTSTGITEMETIMTPESNSMYASLYFNKKFSSIPYSVRLGTNVNSNNSYSYSNSILAERINKNYSVDISFNSNYKPFFNFEVGFDYSYNLNEVKDQRNFEQELKNHEPYIEFRGAIVKSGFDWKTRLTLSSYEGSPVDNFWRWNCEVNYSLPNTKWQLGIIGFNMINLTNDENVRNSIGQFYISQQYYKQLPGYFMFTAKLKF